MKKHIVCFGDSNTHGYCADPNDTADRTDRFNEDERWTCLLQKALGEEYLVLEEGLSGRTTVFSDPLHECMSGLDVIYSTLMSHEPVDLLIIMLGTNDSKPFNWEMPDNANAAQFRADLTALVESYKALKTKPHIYLALPPTAFSDFAQIQNETVENDIIPAIREVAAATGATVIDTHSANKNAQDDFVDGVHPSSDAGRKLLAQTVANAILGK